MVHRSCSSVFCVSACGVFFSVVDVCSLSLAVCAVVPPMRVSVGKFSSC